MYGMTEEELSVLRRLFARQKEIERAVLYGSRVRGVHKPFSDVDITLLGMGIRCIGARICLVTPRKRISPNERQVRSSGDLR